MKYTTKAIKLLKIDLRTLIVVCATKLKKERKNK